MTTDTAQLLATVREALTNYGTWRMQQKHRQPALAALDSLAAELRHSIEDVDAMTRKNLSLTAEIEEKDDAIGAYMKQSSEQADEARKWRQRCLDAEEEEVEFEHSRFEKAEAELERVKAERDATIDEVSLDAAEWMRKWEQAKARLDKSLSALREIQAVQPKRIEWFREHGIVFDKAPGGDDYWQNVAFQIYTDDCEVESLARAAIAEIEG